MFAERIFSIAHYADQVVLIVLAAMSVVSVAMIFERWWFLRKLSNESSRIRMQIKNSLKEGTIEDFEVVAKDLNSIEGRAANQALKHYKNKGEAGLSEVFNTFILTEKPELEKFLPFLATVASNAPFIGLLGTVLGIMKAFNDLSRAQDAGQQTVMAGISIALVATAAGLFVAIPAGMFYNYFSRKVKSILSNIESVKEMGLAYSKKKG